MSVKQSVASVGLGAGPVFAEIRKLMAKVDGAIAGSVFLVALMLFLDPSTVGPSLGFTLGTLW